MHRTLGGLAAALLALTAVPALADDEPAVYAACDGVADADRVTLAGLRAPVAAPLTPSPTLAAAPAPLPRTTPDTVRSFVLDLAGQPVGTAARVDAVLSWSQAVNDFDLFVRSGEQRAASQELNPSGDPREATSLVGLGHCAQLTVSVHNYLAGPDSLQLALQPEVEVPEEL